MKKIIFGLIATLITLTVSLFSCSKENSDSVDIKTENKIIYKNLSLKTDVSPNFYDNHFFLIEELGNNDEKREVIKNVISKGIDLKDLHSSCIKKFHFNNSEIIMFSITINDSDNKVILYKSNDLFTVCKLESFVINDKKQFHLKTINNEIIYSLKLDNQNRIGDFILNKKNLFMDNFSQEIYNLNTDLKLKAGCCRRQSGWSDCMDCTVSWCGSKWSCVAVLALAGPELLAGFGVSCLGAGPSATC